MKKSSTAMALKPSSPGVQAYDGRSAVADAAIEDEEVQAALLPIAARMAAEGDELDDETRTLWEAAKADVKPAKDLGEALYQMVEGVFTLKTLLVPNRPVRRNEPRVGRNDPCPCGSNKKYKQCCGKKA